MVISTSTVRLSGEVDCALIIGKAGRTSYSASRLPGSIRDNELPFYCKIQLQSHFSTKSLSYVKNNCSDPDLNEKKPLILSIICAAINTGLLILQVKNSQRVNGMLMPCQNSCSIIAVVKRSLIIMGFQAPMPYTTVANTDYR